MVARMAFFSNASRSSPSYILFLDMNSPEEEEEETLWESSFDAFKAQAPEAGKTLQSVLI